jgi:hypothetical protein
MNNKRKDLIQKANEFLKKKTCREDETIVRIKGYESVPELMVDFAKQWIELAEERGKRVSGLEEVVKAGNNLLEDQEKHLKAKDKEIEELKSEALFYAITVIPDRDAEIEQSKKELERLKDGIREYIINPNSLNELMELLKQ